MWEKLHLIEKATLFIEEVEERHVHIRAPKIHVRDLEVAPDYNTNGQLKPRKAKAES